MDRDGSRRGHGRRVRGDDLAHRRLVPGRSGGLLHLDGAAAYHGRAARDHRHLGGNRAAAHQRCAAAPGSRAAATRCSARARSAESEHLRACAEQAVAAAQSVELLELAAQRDAVLAARRALAHVAPRAAAGAYALVGRGRDVEADVAARGVARLDRLDQADPRADQQRLHGRHRDRQRVGQLLVGQALHLAHQQRRALLVGQPPHVVDEPAQVLAPLGLLERVQQRRPARDVEQVHRGGHRPAQLVDAAVVRDLVEPRAKRHRAVVGPQRPVGAQEDVLHRILGVRARSGQHLARISEQTVAVALVDDLGRVLVALPEERYKLLIGSQPQERDRDSVETGGCVDACGFQEGSPPTVTASAGGSSVIAQRRPLIRAPPRGSGLSLPYGKERPDPVVAALPERRHHVLDVRVLLDGVHREVLAVAGLAVAAVGHLGGDRDVVVDPNAAEAQGLGDAQGAADVARPDRGREAVLDAVGPVDRLLLVAERLHRDDRAEDLALDHLVVLIEAGDDGRLQEEAGRVGLVAARDDLRVGRLALEEALDALALASRVQRAERRVRAQRVAHDHALRLLGEAADHVVVDAPGGEHPCRRRAVLAGVVVAGARNRLHGGLHVDVVEDHDRRLAAELEVHALERLGRVLGDPLAGLDRAGERHHVHVVVLDQRGAHLVAARDDVEHALGQELGGDLGELDGRDRRRRGRLQDDRVAGGERRADLPDGHHQRVVPRRDLADDADRLAADPGRVALDVLAGRLALEVARRAREEAQVVDHERDLVVLERVDRLAGVGGFELRDLVGALLDRVGELQQGERALAGRGGAPPGVERGAGCLDGTIDVGLGGGGDLGDLLTGGGVEDGVGAALFGGDELAVDEVLKRGGGGAHTPERTTAYCSAPSYLASKGTPL